MSAPISSLSAVPSFGLPNGPVVAVTFNRAVSLIHPPGWIDQTSGLHVIAAHQLNSTTISVQFDGPLVPGDTIVVTPFDGSIRVPGGGVVLQGTYTLPGAVLLAIKAGLFPADRSDASPFTITGATVDFGDAGPTSMWCNHLIGGLSADTYTAHVEQSPNGSGWSTVATFPVVTTSGVQHTLLFKRTMRYVRYVAVAVLAGDTPDVNNSAVFGQGNP